MRTLRIGLLALSCALAAGPANAATFAVDSTADAVDAIPGDGLCATNTGACTLRAAILEANALDGADAIDLPAGSYALGLPGAGEDAAVSGDLDITDALTIQGAGMDVAVIDAAGLDRVIDVVPAPATTIAVALRDLTIRGGSAASEPGEFFVGGGGVRTYDRTLLTLLRVALRDNFSTTRGGGLACYYGNCAVTGGIVAGNTASPGSAASGGGGLWGGYGGRLVVDGTELTDNQAKLGAAIGAAEVDSRLDVHNARIAGNRGLSAIEVSEGGGAVADSVIEDNDATGIATGNDVFLVVARSAIRGNTGASGGGMRLTTAGSGAITVDDSSIYDNESDDAGGGILLFDESRLSVSNTTISGNRAATSGGGIAVVVSIGTLRLDDVTITGNHAPRAGGIALESTFMLASLVAANSIVAQNHGSDGDCVASGVLSRVQIASDGYNLIGDASECNWTPAVGDQLGTVATPIDAMLGPLSWWSGPTLMHAPLPGSPAIDAGNPAAPSETGSACRPTDQRGVARPIDGDGVDGARCDIGAMEAPWPRPAACGLGAELVLVLGALRAASRRRA